jgi:putative ABC transport system permease protein
LRHDGFQVQSLEIVVQIANRIVTAITVMFMLIGGIALLVATIGIANTMVMAIYERTREIGILKAMGASRGEIRRMFMMEAGCIGLIGGVIGLLLGWLAGLGLDQVIPVYLRYRELPVRGDFFVVTPTLAVGVIVFATLIGLVAGLLPAQRAAKLDPLEALRHE